MVEVFCVNVETILQNLTEVSVFYKLSSGDVDLEFCFLESHEGFVFLSSLVPFSPPCRAQWCVFLGVFWFTVHPLVHPARTRRLGSQPCAGLGLRLVEHQGGSL